MADDVKAAPAPKPDRVAAAEQEISWIGARMREPSTYAGLGTLSAAVAIFHLLPGNDATDLVKDITMAGMAIGGIIAIVMPEATKLIAKLGKGAGAVLLALALAGAVAHTDSAMAQSARVNSLSLRKPAVTGNIVKDLKTDLDQSATPSAAAPSAANPLATIMQQIESVQAKTAADVIADIQAADADAGTVVTPATATTPAIVKDPISHACYPALVQLLQSLPTAKAPTGTLVGVQLFQDSRDFIAQIQGGIPTYLKLGCAPLLGDEVNILVQALALVGVKILPAALTAAIPALAPITLPAMTLTP